MVQLCSVGVVVCGEQIKSNILEKIHVFGCLFLPVLEFFSWPLNKCLFRFVLCLIRSSVASVSEAL